MEFSGAKEGKIRYIVKKRRKCHIRKVNAASKSWSSDRQKLLNKLFRNSPMKTEKGETAAFPDDVVVAVANGGDESSTTAAGIS